MERKRSKKNRLQEHSPAKACEDRLPSPFSESADALETRTSPHITGEKAKFNAWSAQEGGEMRTCLSCQRLRKMEQVRVKLDTDGTLYGPLPTPITKRSPGGELSQLVREVISSAERTLKTYTLKSEYSSKQELRGYLVGI